MLFDQQYGIKDSLRVMGEPQNQNTALDIARTATPTHNPSSSAASGRLCMIADSRSAVSLSGFAVEAEYFRSVPEIPEQSRHPGRGSSLLRGFIMG